MAERVQRSQESGEKSVKVEYSGNQVAHEQQGKILFSVGEEMITLGEFERRLNAQAPMARARYNTTERKKAFMDNMIKFEVLAQEARKKGFHEDPQVLLELKQAMVRRLMSDALEKSVSPEAISKEEKRAYYDKNVSDYVRPEKVRASHILLPDKASADKVVRELEAEFRKDPTHKRRIFALKARAVSKDKVTANLGGDMRFFARPEDGGTVNKKVAEVAFAGKDIGKLEGPFESENGWHLLMVTARRQRYEKTFEEVERSIGNRLFRERRSMAELDFVEKAKKNAKIEIHPELLSKIPDPPAPDAGHSGKSGHGH